MTRVKIVQAYRASDGSFHASATEAMNREKALEADRVAKEEEQRRVKMAVAKLGVWDKVKLAAFAIASGVVALLVWTFHRRGQKIGELHRTIQKERVEHKMTRAKEKLGAKGKNHAKAKQSYMALKRRHAAHISRFDIKLRNLGKE